MLLYEVDVFDAVPDDVEVEVVLASDVEYRLLARVRGLVHFCVGRQTLDIDNLNYYNNRLNFF